MWYSAYAAISAISEPHTQSITFDAAGVSAGKALSAPPARLKRLLPMRLTVRVIGRRMRWTMRVRWMRFSSQDWGGALGGGGFHAEFVGPGYQWAEQELVVDQDHHNHRQDHIPHRMQVFLGNGQGQV